jgi:hypothetical protein
VKNLIGIDKVVYRDKIEAPLKLIPEGYFRKKGKIDNQDRKYKSGVGYYPVCHCPVVSFGQQEQVEGREQQKEGNGTDIEKQPYCKYLQDAQHGMLRFGKISNQEYSPD